MKHKTQCVPVDCQYNVVAMSLIAAVWPQFLNATLLPSAITHVRRITVSYHSVDCSVQHSSVTIACMRL